VTTKKMSRAAVNWLDSRQAARLVWLVAVATLSLCAVLAVKQYHLTRCQAAYAEASNASQRARAEAAETDRRAQDTLFQAIADQPREAIVALRKYNESRAIADEQRAKNPVPPAPSTNCG
jgi:hypothetical protein